MQLAAGDLLKIRLVNQLPPLAETGYAVDPGEAFLALNPTNLHLHGMLVSPKYATAGDPTWGDNVFVYNFNSENGRPTPESSLHGPALFDVVDYSVPVPLSHPSGLYWFHPHVHGILESQIAAGLSGIVTVGQVSDYVCTEPKCAVTDRAALDVRHLILKDAAIRRDSTLSQNTDSSFCGPSPETAEEGSCAGIDQIPFGGYSDFSGGRWFFTVNGQQYPTITVGAPAGQIWRIVNASADVTYRLKVWDPKSQRQLMMRVLSVDGVSVDAKAGGDVSHLIEQAGNRFEPVPCPAGDPEPDDAVCTTMLHLMPSSRAEVWITYRDATGAISSPPPGAAAVLRTIGFQTGPEGDTWPAIDLARVQFAGTRAPLRALAVTAQTSLVRNPQSISANLKMVNVDVPSDPTCSALAPGHTRRIFLSVTSTAPRSLGLGYEELDENGEPVPGTFLDVAPFDPTAPTVCLPLAPGDLPVTERWELVNLGAVDHNFHIHQAHFSVLSAAEVAGTAIPDQLRGRAVMMDSLPLLHADGFCASVADWRNGACTTHPATVEVSFAVAGDFVYHCHIASHEDGGMMAVIRVRSAAQQPGSNVVSRLLSALRALGDGPRQPVTPRIGGAMCRTPRSPPLVGPAIRTRP